jgi:hypothetical protein
LWSDTSLAMGGNEETDNASKQVLVGSDTVGSWHRRASFCTE